MNVYCVDSVILVAAENPDQAIKICEELYGDAPGAVAEIVPIDKVNEAVFIRANVNRTNGELFETICLKELFNNAVLNNTPRILIDALYDSILIQ